MNTGFALVIEFLQEAHDAQVELEDAYRDGSWALVSMKARQIVGAKEAALFVFEQMVGVAK